MSLKNQILASTSHAEANANLAIAQAHPHISGKNLRRCVTAHRSVIERLPVPVVEQPVPITSTVEVKPKRVRKTPAKPRVRKVAVVTK